jgi:putative transposase
VSEGDVEVEPRSLALLFRVGSSSPDLTWRSRQPGPRTRENAALSERIEALHDASDKVKGSPRICTELRGEGDLCSVNRVARLMRVQGLRGIPQRKAWRH